MGVLALGDNLTVMEKNLSTTSLSLTFVTLLMAQHQFSIGILSNLNSPFLCTQ